jgi:heterodisulfide reductase subunit A-like polyferredoxin
MFLRGFAAAARAMVLFGGTSHRPKRHGISFAPPEPELSPEIRLGVFVCRCNDSLGWVDGMSEYIEGMLSQEDVVHAEVMPAVCVPEGYSSILRTIREKGITRVALASCVCCPRNFVCSACSDQRSRLKDGLFTGTGISRSMVETCNLRGEVLALVKQDSSLAFARFAGLIDRSVRRARRLKPFSASARNYNFTTAVIGMSEAAYNSALTLAEAGLEVLLFGTPGKPLVDAPDHPNIHRFEGFLVKELSGTLGDFQVFVETGDFQQILQVGAVILSEKARKNIPYIHQDGLPGGIVEFDVQKGGVSGVSFFDHGETSISGLYLANPPGIHVSNRTKGAAAAVLAAAIMPSGPRQSVGFTAVVDENLCRGCGRCIRVCAYQAITLYRNAIDGWYASVDEALCRGCGNCISVCPSNAADSPYRNQAFLEQTLEEILMQ